MRNSAYMCPEHVEMVGGHVISDSQLVIVTTRPHTEPKLAKETIIPDYLEGEDCKYYSPAL